ncbi:hypothetical protein [Sphingopyxis sp. PET50]|uniref:hypothetical protein n=1 Tax=Sphingopyxis sp. PET50 TaxID=2976533 RepID=UPI0021AEC45E|nr:hypothetical protein [Sphingopyxis sp. PET50]
MASPYLRAALLGCTVFAGIGSAQAQGRYGDLTSPRSASLLDDFDRRLGDMHNDRLRAYRETRQQLVDGWCERRLSNLDSLYELVEREAKRLSKDDLAAYRQALAQERAYPCPPGGPPTPPPPPLPPSPPPAPPVAPAVMPGAAVSQTSPEDMARNRENQTMTYDPGPFLPGPVGGTPAPAPAAPSAPASAKPAQGLTEADVKEVARQQSLFDVVERERREEAERKKASVEVAAGAGQAGIPGTNYGFVRDGPVPAPETAALTGQQHLPMIVIDGAAIFQGIGRFSLRYAEGDAENSVDRPAGPAGTARGFPYTAESPSGSTGIAGNVPLRVASEVAAQEFRAGFRHSVLPPARPFDRAGSAFDLYVGVEGVVRDRDHRGEVSITTPVIASQLIEQDVDERELHLLLGGQAVLPIGPAARFVIGAEATGYLYDFDFDSLETVDQNFGAAADRHFTRRIEDGKSGAGYGGTIRGELTLDLGARPVDAGHRRAELFVAAQGSYFSDRAQLRNPTSGDFVLVGGTSGLGTDDVYDWSVSLGFRLVFGGARFRF